MTLGKTENLIRDRVDGLSDKASLEEFSQASIASLYQSLLGLGVGRIEEAAPTNTCVEFDDSGVTVS
jgi:hypothetical protein